MKKYLFTVVLCVPVDVYAENREEAIEKCKSEYLDYVDEAYLEDIILDREKEV